MKLTKRQLLMLLADLIECIGKDDSFEGSLSYSCMIEEVPCERGEFEVQSSYRIGNSEGQGGMRIVEPSVAQLPVDDT